jgi:ABC-type amino acid transport substrate-binding protein
VGSLRVCLGESDAPRSEASPARGFDVDVAQLLADGLNRDLQPVWLPAPNPTEIESTDIDYGRLLAGRCDVQLSIPGLAALGSLGQRLALTQPYYGAGFELAPAEASMNLDVPGDARIAVRGNTVAHILVDRLGFQWTMRRDGADIAAAVNSGEADAALIWGPELASVGLSYNADFQAPAVLRWNHHGVTRTADVALRDAINSVLARADIRDDIATSMRAHGVPAHAPFASVHQLEMLKEQ